MALLHEVAKLMNLARNSIHFDDGLVWSHWVLHYNAQDQGLGADVPGPESWLGEGLNVIVSTEKLVAVLLRISQ